MKRTLIAVLTLLVTISVLQPAQARLSEGTETASAPRGSVLAVDKQTGQTCFLKHTEPGITLQTPIAGGETSAQANQAAAVVANAGEIPACSAEMREKSRELVAAIENGNRQAIAPVVAWGLGALGYWALCSGVNLAELHYDRLEKPWWQTATLTVCSPATAVNLGILIVFVLPNLKLRMF